MHMRFKVCQALCVGLLCLGTTLPAAALEVDGLQLPDTFAVDGKNLQVNGAGSRFTAARRPFENAPFCQTRRRADAIKARDYYLNANCSAPCALHEPARAAFFKAMADLKTDDEESYIFTTQGLSIQRNGILVASMADPTLAKVVLAAWIGDEPTTPELKAALLGLNPRPK